MDNILENINKASLKLLEQLTTHDTLATIVDEAIKLVEADEGLILLKENEELKNVYGSTPVAAAIIPRKRGFAYTSYRERKAFVIGKEDIMRHDPKSVALGVRSWIFIPLSYRKDSIGVLVVRSYKENIIYTERELSILSLFGSMASLAIKKAQQYHEATKALEIRDMFISMAAHELRTPLTSINGYIQLLYSKLAQREGVEGKWIKELYEESKRMTTLIKELLEVNRIKAGQQQFMWQECNLVDVLTEAIQETQSLHQFQEREVEFENKLRLGEDRVIGDPSKLSKVFANIIDNAFKYSSKTTRVLIDISLKAGFITVSIKDQGKGIDEKDMPHIFTGQHKGEGGEEGLGIGLFFVESVIRQHRGSIDVKTKLKKGTTFIIKLPKARI